MNWYLKVLNKYADFSGRARRKEYWMFVLFNTCFTIIAMILDNLFGIDIEGVGFGLLTMLYTLITLIPGLAVAVRRLHDVGNSGRIILFALIPLIGSIWLLVLMATDSNPGKNMYGENPKDISNEKHSESADDTIIFLIVIWMFVSQLFFTLMAKFHINYYQEGWFQSINALCSLTWQLVPIGLASTLKNKTKQIILFIIGGILLVNGLYEIVHRLAQYRY